MWACPGTGGTAWPCEDELFLMGLEFAPERGVGAIDHGGWRIARGTRLGPRVWAVLDEGEIKDCARPSATPRLPRGRGLEIERLRASVDGKAGKTEDAEAITLHKDTGYVYILEFPLREQSRSPATQTRLRRPFRETDVGQSPKPGHAHGSLPPELRVTSPHQRHAARERP